MELDPYHFGYRGWIKLRKLKDFKGAFDDFNSFDQLTPSSVDYAWGEHIFYLKAECKLGLNQLDSAVIYYTKYINDVSKTNGAKFVDINAFIYRGICFFLKNKLSKSSADFDSCLKYNSKSSEALFYKGIIHYKNKKYKQSLAFLVKAKENFKKGYYHFDSYNEYILQLYDSDIECQINKVLKLRK